MAIIRLSTQMKKMWRDGFANYSSRHQVGTSYTYSLSGQSSYYRIIIFSGTINDLGSSTQLYEGQLTTTMETDGNNENIIYSTGMNGATASGTASWFRVANTFPYNTDTIFYGTIGIDGSGADLMIGNTAIISGQQYVMSGLRLKFSNAI